MPVPKGTRVGGRQKGTPNKRTEKVQQAAEAAADAIAEAIPGSFTGDAHALLMAVYKNPAHEWQLRIDAAKAAVRYEKPALSSVTAEVDARVAVEAIRRTIVDPAR